MSLEKFSYPKEKIKILLLEDINEEAKRVFNHHGFPNIILKKEPLQDINPLELSDVHIIGVRSKSKITEEVLLSSPKLLSIGCFCIGTDNVDLKRSALQGVPVFNAPFSNTRSVAELTMALVVMLARKVPFHNKMMHKGIWSKTASQSYEVRGKSIGIVGYGHIGSQVGVLAESYGMKVFYYDIVKKLPLGNAKALPTLEDLLKISDFVTLHVPDTKETRGMINKEQLSLMKKGACLLNLSRGKVVNLEALKDAILSGHIKGASLDVYPEEPSKKGEPFSCPLIGLDNVILTPHIGGSTVEAQVNIAKDVSQTLIEFIDVGSTIGTVNFPEINLPRKKGCHRILHIHKNVPGVLSKVNAI
ncbi:MAG: phosphoglycerate dehydrogenase, partial [Candidatus Dadabacteria bacterium]